MNGCGLGPHFDMAELEAASINVTDEPYAVYEESGVTSCGTEVNTMDKPDWMKEMGPRFANAKVGEIVWPGTHDSGAYCEEFDFTRVVHPHWSRYVGTHLLNCFCRSVKQFVCDWSRAQALSVGQQLKHGVRYIDLRISKCTKDGNHYIVHTFCGPELDEVLQDIADFLSEHDRECVLIEVDPVSEIDHVELHDIFERKLDNYLLRREHGSRLVSPITLTLSHLIEKGRVVVLYRLPALYGFMNRVLCFWDFRCLHAPFVMSINPQTKESYQLEEFTKFSSLSHGVHEKKHNYIFHFMYALTPSLGDIVKSSSIVKYFSDDEGDPANLQGCAQILNPNLPKFMSRIKDHIESEQCHDMGMIISVDFVEESQLLSQVIDLNTHKFKSSGSRLK